MPDFVSGIAPKPGEPVSAVVFPQKVPEQQTLGDRTVITSQGEPLQRSEHQTRHDVNTEPEQTQEEYADMLRQLNLILNVFEIAAEYSVEDDGHRISIIVHNTHTGEVIRRIPPYEFTGDYNNLKRGLGIQVNASA